MHNIDISTIKKLDNYKRVHSHHEEDFLLIGGYTRSMERHGDSFNN